jgi:ABC-2 type transport system permease protein
MNGGVSRASGAAALRLLIQVNVWQAWRRLLAVREQSRLLTALIVLFMAGYVLLSFLLFYRGLRFAGTFPGLGQVLVERMLFLLFAFLFVLLLLSNLVISYTNLFRNRETSFLLPLPVSAQTIFQWKFLESTLLASWAFVFMIAPLLAAYGLTQGVRWHFYPITVALLTLFLVLPAVAGAWAAVNVARYLDRRAFQITAMVGVGLFLAASVLWFRPEPLPEEQLETRVLVVLDRLLLKTRFAQFPWLPSYWLSAGVQQWAEGAVTAAGFFALVLLSHVLFFGSLLFTRMGDRFYRALSAAHSRGSVFARWDWFRAWQDRRSACSYRPGLVERVFGCLPAIRQDVRALLVKDVLVFWRDTTQWGQTLVLFGLLAVYIINLRHFTQNLTTPFWIYLVSFLNLAACSLNLATLTTRFVFPQFSLEGKRLWIVGLAPLGLPRVLLAKLALASAASLGLTLSLMQLSCWMLKLAWDRTLYLSAAVTIMTFTLNGLAIGLGALYPNLKEDNPSKIVSGFGGTFCLVLSFLYILGSVVLLAVGSPWSRRGAPPPWLVAACWFGFAALSMLLGWLPLKLGLRRAARFEY